MGSEYGDPVGSPSVSERERARDERGSRRTGARKRERETEGEREKNPPTYSTLEPINSQICQSDISHPL